MIDAPPTPTHFTRFERFAAAEGLDTAPIGAPMEPAGTRQRKGKAPAAASSVDAYYDASRKEFVMRNEGGRWLSHPPRQFQMLLKASGVAVTPNTAEKAMCRIINTRDVGYTGSLAGHRAGYHEANGVRMLVTEEPKLLEPVPGDWPAIDNLLRGLLCGDEYAEVQYTTFLYWVRSAFESISTGRWRPAQVLALAGPIGCGKSLLQRLITEMIGGRSAACFRYLSGRTEFNRELFAAEHLFVDDEQASTDFRTRMHIAAHLKALAVGRDHQCHGKSREAVNLRPLWRCTLSLNDEGECLLVLPPLRADIADKIHIFRCFSPFEPFPTDTPEAMAEYWETLVGELPAFLDHCCQVQPPEGRTDTRFGVRAFHHPTLVLELENQSPEVVLLELIDLELWRDATVTEWEGTARELESELLGMNSNVRQQAQRILAWPTACGTYLSRLAKNQPDRVECDRGRDKRAWIIKKPRSVTR